MAEFDSPEANLIWEEVQALAADLNSHKERADRYEAALRRLAQPTSSPLIEEAALVQIEVMQIAQEALDG